MSENTGCGEDEACVSFVNKNSNGFKYSCTSSVRYVSIRARQEKTAAQKQMRFAARQPARLELHGRLISLALVTETGRMRHS